MSDQQSSLPPKPKPGSLRDRIAAFEKSASAAAPAPTGQAPAPRPKPSGFASWKPKAPSPSSSPSLGSVDNADSSPKTTKTMSASDAKESITKGGGGSLKDRMAALQGRGAFGAPAPPLAPKPAAEKPRWKPPPVVAAPVDDDHDDTAGEEPPTAIAATVERTKSPPVSVKSRGSIDLYKPIVEGEESSTVEPVTSTERDNQGTADPEGEERQRRAAIAARMARLGGARMGMAPPVLAQKPPVPVRKPTREEVPKQEDREEVPRRESLSLEERDRMVEADISPSSPNADEGATLASPPSLTHVQSQSAMRPPSVRKNSENASLLSVDSADSNNSRSPPSMPVPTVPRRAGPPRKKPVKPNSPPPEVPEVPEEPPAVFPPVDELVVKPPEEEAIEAPAPELEDHKEIQIHDEPQSIDSDIHHEPSEELVAEGGPAGPVESKAQYFPGSTGFRSSVPFETSEGPQREDHIDFDYSEEDPDHSEDTAIRYNDHGIDDGDEVIDSSDEHSDDNHAAEHHEHQHLHEDDDHHSDVDVDAGPQSSSAVDVTGAEDEDEDEDAEEEARRKRIAERLTKMGGVNPFAAPLLSPPLRRPSEEIDHVSTPFVSSRASPPTIALSPSDIPSSVHSPHEVAKPPMAEPKAEEEQGEAEDSDVEVEDEDNDVYDENGSFDEAPAHEKPIEESSLSAHDLSHPPPIPSSTRPHVQVQQYGLHDDEGKEHGAHPATRHLSPSSRLPDPSVCHEETPSPPARPAQPPRRIVPQAPEEQEQEVEEEEEEEEEEEARADDEEHENLAPSHLFVRAPVHLRGPIPQHPVRGGVQRYEEDEDGDGSENDAPALPVLQRRSMDVPPRRSIPPPPPPPVALHHLHHHGPPSDISDSDHDGQALPVRPRHIAVPPAPPMPVQVPPTTPRRSVPVVPASEETFSSSYGTPSVAVSEPEPEEILDEEEGDPIDPAFHTPSRPSSAANLRGSAPGDTPGLPVQISSPAMSDNSEEHEEALQQQDQDQVKRRTIAERMAKLGGIKFGAAPMSAQPPPRVLQREERGEESGSHHPEPRPQVAEAENAEQPVEFSEEEEERARKERIAAKLAGMGGMRIGMIPIGMAPQKAHVLRDENVASPSPTRVVPPPPPTRPRPPPTTRPQTQDTDSEHASDDGVQVEAEESEIEEVNYEDAVEEPEETTPPPPVPSRGGRGVYRSESTDKATFSPPYSPPLIPGSRPPVPVVSPNRRSSIQTSKSTGSVDFGSSPPRTPSSHIHAQSEYVMVDEPRSFDEAPPPVRRISRAPVRPPPNSMAVSDDSISSQWELPSIPTATLDFGTSTDLSLSSWTDAGEPTASPTASPQSPPRPNKQPTVSPTKRRTLLPSELQLTPDDLMMMWGRVGVQVCEVATSLFEKSKKTLIGDGTYAGFVTAVLAGVPNAALISIDSGEYGYLVYAQTGSSVQKRVSEIMPGDIVEIHDGKLKGHKGIQIYHQNVGGSGEVLLGIVGEFEAKKSKIRVFHANQHVGQQTVESVSYRLEDLKSGTVKVYRVLEG